MKHLSILLVIIFTMICIPAAYGQNVIATQADLNALLDPGPGLTQFPNPNWTFQPQPGIQLTIPPGATLRIDEGVNIAMAPAFSLLVHGTLISRDINLDGQFALTNIGRQVLNTPWANLRLIDGAAIGATIDLRHCDISGGGDAAVFNGDLIHDYQGMIVVQYALGVQNQHPHLFMTDCNLHGSQTNGIVAEVPAAEGPQNCQLTMELRGTTMNTPAPDNITRSGVKIGDIAANPPINGALLAHILVDASNLGVRSDFQWCGLHGFSYYFFRGECFLFNSNYWNNGIGLLPGSGIFFSTTVAFYMMGDAVLNINNVQTHDNSQDGIHIYNGAAYTLIENSQIYHNSQRGIYYDFMGGAVRDQVRVLNNHIYENDWEGIFAQKGHAEDGSIWVNSNHFEDNGQDILDFPWLPTPWKAANIRLHGRLSLCDGWHGNGDPAECQIMHNRLEGAYSGIVIEPLENEDPNNGMPGNIDVRNNVQLGDPVLGTYYGIYIEQFAPNAGAGAVVYNNIFSNDNATAGVDGAGIYILRRPVANGGLVSNNLVLNSDVGIWDADLAADVTYDYAGFSGVPAGNLVRGSWAGMNIVNANPVLVGGDDWHLQWNSPMINTGCNVGFDAWNRPWIDPDQSRNDIGTYGGDGADNFIWAGWEDYVAILLNSHLTNDFLGSLRWDTYWMFGNSDVLQAQGQALDIDPGTTILMFPGVSFKEAGVTLRINGTGWDVGERVLIRARDELDDQQYQQSNPHGGVHFNGGQGNISFLDIWGAGANSSYALDLNSGADVEFSDNHCHHSYGGLLVTGATPVDIDDSQFDFNQYWGIYLSNTGQNVGIHRCHVNDNYERGIRASYGVREIVDTDVLRNGWQGVWLSYCAGTPDLLGVHSNENDPGDRPYASYGYYLLETDADFNLGNRQDNPRCEANHNYSYGLGTSTGAVPTLRSSDFIENGRDDTPRYEINVATSQVVDFAPPDGGNWVDDRRGFNHRVLINRATMAGGQISGVGTDWWISGAANWQVCYPTNQFDPALRLLTEETIDDWVTVADVREDQRAWAAFREADALLSIDAHEDALRAFVAVIRNHPMSAAARKAISSLSTLHHLMGRSNEQLNRLLDDLDIPEDAVMLRDEVFYNRLYNLVPTGEYDQALTGLRDRCRNASDELDSLRAATAIEEITLVEILDERDGDLDASNNIAVQNKRLSDAVDALIAAESSPEVRGHPEVTVPAQFEILQANPNPFNSTITITYGMPLEELVSVKVFDLSGREVACLFEGRRAAGIHRQVWLAEGAPSGIYICKVKAGGQERSVKLNLIR